MQFTDRKSLNKQKRVVNKTLIKSLRGEPCVVCMRPGVAHHIRTVGARGDDVLENLMVLCPQHHHDVHLFGLTDFSLKHPTVRMTLEDKCWMFDGVKWHYFHS